MLMTTQGNKHKLWWQLCFLLFLIVASVIIIKNHKEMEYIKNSGYVFGTVYNITYQYDRDLTPEITARLKEVDEALSTFNPQSVISLINSNQNMMTNSMFDHVFTLAMQVSDDTHGAFDITVAPLVNQWGFGFKHGTMPTPEVIDSLRQLVGYRQVKLTNHRIIKHRPEIMLDCSAIAKGYGCDAVAQLLRSLGITNFLVEIGGEVVASGKNARQDKWRIGVTKPIDDSLNVNNEMQTILPLTDMAMATSGNYRNFYYKNGRKYAHTINPKTGMPVQHNILSATVITNSCAKADAYATAFMVMGLDSAKAVMKRHPEMMAYFICDDGKGGYKVWKSEKLNVCQ